MRGGFGKRSNSESSGHPTRITDGLVVLTTGNHPGNTGTKSDGELMNTTLRLRADETVSTEVAVVPLLHHLVRHLLQHLHVEVNIDFPLITIAPPLMLSVLRGENTILTAYATIESETMYGIGAKTTTTGDLTTTHGIPIDITTAEMDIGERQLVRGWTMIGETITTTVTRTDPVGATWAHIVQALPALPLVPHLPLFIPLVLLHRQDPILPHQ